MRVAVLLVLSQLTKSWRETVVTIRGRSAGVGARSPQQLAGKLREVRQGAALDPVTAVKLLQCDAELLVELLTAARELKETQNRSCLYILIYLNSEREKRKSRNDILDRITDQIKSIAANDELKLVF